jgi:hypothetical protein
MLHLCCTWCSLIGGRLLCSLQLAASLHNHHHLLQPAACDSIAPIKIWKSLRQCSQLRGRGCGQQCLRHEASSMGAGSGMLCCQQRQSSVLRCAEIGRPDIVLLMGKWNLAGSWWHDKGECTWVWFSCSASLCFLSAYRYTACVQV